MRQVEMFRSAHAPADKSAAVAIEHHHADAGPIRKVSKRMQNGELRMAGSGQALIFSVYSLFRDFAIHPAQVCALRFAFLWPRSR